jgi:hypothetical protein
MRTPLLKRATNACLSPNSIYRCTNLFIFFISLTFQASGQNPVLPEDRTFDWHQAGLKTEMTFPVTTVNVLDHGLVNDGSSPNDEVLKSLLAETIEFDFVELFFPEGEYLFLQAIELRSNVLIRGVYPGTVLVFQQIDSQHSIIATGSLTDISSTLTTTTDRSTHFLTVDNPTAFKAGDIIRISEQDQALVTSDWAIGSTGQINFVSEIKGDSIILEHRLRRVFSPANAAKIERIDPVSNISISELKIERQDATINQTSNIFFNYAVNCSISCIESYHCNFAHIDIRNSSNIEVKGSYFHEGFTYGGGGKAYGVMLHFSTGECRITNSVFRKLRHAMILQAGANGNVFAYNYSYEPYWTGTILPANAAGDIVLHGNYPYANLFEGNSGQNIVIDDSHGQNGPFNTFLRNRADGYGIFMNFNPPSNQQTFIANEITNSTLGFYLIQGTDHVQIANNVLNISTPSGGEDLDLVSFIYDDAPSFFTLTEQWPNIGYPNNLSEDDIPAERRVESNQWIACSEPIAITTSTEPLLLAEKKLVLYPNPVNESFSLDCSAIDRILSLKLFNFQGEIIRSFEEAKRYDVQGLNSGVYWLEVRFENQPTALVKLVKK